MRQRLSPSSANGCFSYPYNSTSLTVNEASSKLADDLTTLSNLLEPLKSATDFERGIMEGTVRKVWYLMTISYDNLANVVRDYNKQIKETPDSGKKGLAVRREAVAATTISPYSKTVPILTQVTFRACLCTFKYTDTCM
jgi:hypothetical protein